jgi:hypothetical protein
VVFELSIVETVPAVLQVETPPTTIGSWPAAQLVAAFGTPSRFVVAVDTPEAGDVAAVGRFGVPPFPGASPWHCPPLTMPEPHTNVFPVLLSVALTEGVKAIVQPSVTVPARALQKYIVGGTDAPGGYW